ncbi:hypothetical protein EKD00_01895 [Chlorobium phaeovibrioides]|uniref:Uncharacterized protein n=1 Tax=Chlorobium phaeovibrioides TaxID=1094 RepID=A0A3S0L212_CHLPH|nr:hypothetical protein [Chlorobium phaeovibrioides]KAA6233128.1 hypothetical protein FP507_08810 [Chlorobium phaeovibrioides]RTY36520.1 hypothetical protein EKD00_01895 [Chlorobium phaeovibrioides]RTY39561.1 hypothetical protein EKD02_02490 [Chlorobium phaeovibrioides]
MNTPDNNSFITLHRRIMQWEWYTDANTIRVFLHLILTANHKETRWRGELIKRGQVLTGLNQLSRDLKLSVKKIRVALEHLISTGEVANRSTNKYRVITIINYNAYQDRKEREGQAGRQTERQSKGNQRAASNNVNKGNNKKEEGRKVQNPGFSVEFIEKAWAFFATNKVKPYGAIKTQNIALQQLFSMAGGNEEIAKDALRQTLANNYQGYTWFFDRKHKGENNGLHTRNNQGQAGQPTKADHAALMQQLVDRTTGMG